jgi:hypothetical protein
MKRTRFGMVAVPGLAALALTLGAMTATAPAAHAQTVSRPLLRPARPFALKLGLGLPTTKRLREATDDVLYGFGGEYNFLQTQGGNPAVVGVFLDSIRKDGDNNEGSITGTGIQGRFYFNRNSEQTGLYGLAGVGLYYLRVKSGGFSDDGWRFGGKLGLGVSTGSRLFFEADYTRADELEGVESNAFRLWVGFRL